MKYRLKIIVALISAAILGLIIVQVIWINNAIDLRKSQFDEDIRTSLYGVTQKIPFVVQDNLEQNFLKNQSLLNSSTSDINDLMDVIFKNSAFKQFSEKITAKQIDSLIAMELTKKGINTPYVFSVFNTSFFFYI